MDKNGLVKRLTMFASNFEFAFSEMDLSKTIKEIFDNYDSVKYPTYDDYCADALKQLKKKIKIVIKEKYKNSPDNFFIKFTQITLSDELKDEEKKLSILSSVIKSLKDDFDEKSCDELLAKNSSFRNLFYSVLGDDEDRRIYDELVLEYSSLKCFFDAYLKFEKTEFDEFKTSNKILTNREVKELYERIRNGDSSAVEILLEKNIGLVKSIASRYRFKVKSEKYMSFDDLVQYGTIGLLDAINKFDPGKGCKFATYATYWIAQRIDRAIINFATPIRVPASIHLKNNVIRRGINELERKLERVPTEEEIISELCISKKQLKNFYDTMLIQNPSSLNKPALNDDKSNDTEIGDFIADMTNYFEEVDDEDFISNLKKLLGEILTPREYFVMCKRLGLDGKPMRLEKVGILMNITRERARQIQAKAERKIRINKKFILAYNNSPDPTLLYSLADDCSSLLFAYISYVTGLITGNMSDKDEIKRLFSHNYSSLKEAALSFLSGKECYRDLLETFKKNCSLIFEDIDDKLDSLMPEDKIAFYKTLTPKRYFAISRKEKKVTDEQISKLLGLKDPNYVARYFVKPKKGTSDKCTEGLIDLSRECDDVTLAYILHRVGSDHSAPLNHQSVTNIMKVDDSFNLDDILVKAEELLRSDEKYKYLLSRFLRGNMEENSIGELNGKRRVANSFIDSLKVEYTDEEIKKLLLYIPEDKMELLKLRYGENLDTVNSDIDKKEIQRVSVYVNYFKKKARSILSREKDDVNMKEINVSDNSSKNKEQEVLKSEVEEIVTNDKIVDESTEEVFTKVKKVLPMLYKFLTPCEYFIVKKYEQDDLSYDDIAKLLGVSPSFVSKQYENVIKWLNEHKVRECSEDTKLIIELSNKCTDVTLAYILYRTGFIDKNFKASKDDNFKVAEMMNLSDDEHLKTFKEAKKLLGSDEKYSKLLYKFLGVTKKKDSDYYQFLTPREYFILSRYKENKSNEYIARLLGSSIKDISNYFNYRKKHPISLEANRQPNKYTKLLIDLSESCDDVMLAYILHRVGFENGNAQKKKLTHMETVREMRVKDDLNEVSKKAEDLLRSDKKYRLLLGRFLGVNLGEEEYMEELEIKEEKQEEFEKVVDTKKEKVIKKREHGATAKSFIESLRQKYSDEEIEKIISSISDGQMERLKLRYGENLDTVNSDIDKKEIQRISVYVSSIKSRGEAILSRNKKAGTAVGIVKKGREPKSFIESLKEKYSDEEIKKIISSIPEGQMERLRLRYGENLDTVNSGVDKNIIRLTAVFVTRLKKNGNMILSRGKKVGTVVGIGKKGPEPKSFIESLKEKYSDEEIEKIISSISDGQMEHLKLRYGENLDTVNSDIDRSIIRLTATFVSRLKKNGNMILSRKKKGDIAIGVSVKDKTSPKENKAKVDVDADVNAGEPVVETTIFEEDEKIVPSDDIVSSEEFVEEDNILVSDTTSDNSLIETADGIENETEYKDDAVEEEFEEEFDSLDDFDGIYESPTNYSNNFIEEDSEDVVVKDGVTYRRMRTEEILPPVSIPTFDEVIDAKQLEAKENYEEDSMFRAHIKDELLKLKAHLDSVIGLLDTQNEKIQSSILSKKKD